MGEELRSTAHLYGLRIAAALARNHPEMTIAEEDRVRAARVVRHYLHQRGHHHLRPADAFDAGFVKGFSMTRCMLETEALLQAAYLGHLKGV